MGARPIVNLERQSEYFIQKESHYWLVFNVNDIFSKETSSRIASFSFQPVFYILQVAPRRIPPVADEQELASQRMKHESNIAAIEITNFFENRVIFCLFCSGRRKAT